MVHVDSLGGDDADDADYVGCFRSLMMLDLFGRLPVAAAAAAVFPW